ncbi:MAG TPA: hypothetical protein VGN11_10230, partial [Candidatus Baltobacteraceae bacterium]|nr:hypothetical protein [Candidatus Baltobacteraceae bacterium]
PIVPFRNVQVLYGSGGSDFLGVNAIGGVVHFETLDPTPEAQFSYDQGYGTFGRLASSATATGMAGHLGYALAYGASGLDGPLSHTLLYQPNAAFDQSATLPAVRNLAVYPDDSSAISRSSLVKLRYGDDAHNSVTFTSVISSYWVDKTGNGDGDYLDYTPALAFGEQLLAHKTSSDPCAAGTFTATNANGVPNGAGPGGIADGGVACQTPAQYAFFNEGWQGSGTSWQTFALNDEDLAFRHAGAHSRASVDAFTTRYDNNIDRRFNLPFVALPGDKGSSKSSQVTSNGVLAQKDFLGERNDVGAGFSYLNNAYLQRAVNANGKVTSGSPVDTETAFFVRDAYHPEHSNLSGFLTVWAKRASETQTSYIDPRIALVYHTTPRDIVRASFGATTTQPSSDMIGEPFIQAPPGGAGGGASITCGGLNSIGSAPSSLLKPERGVDQELAYAHRWTRDTQVQVSLYNVNVFDKLYSTIVPLSQTGTTFIDPAYLASVNAQIAGKCGAAVAPSLLGVSGNFNVGTLRARGLDIAGRYRIDPRLFFDYDWSLTSTILLGANPLLLQKTLTLIPGDQVPRLPLHTFSGSFDATMRDGLNVRYTLHAVSVNNTKALPAYDYSDLRLLYPLRRGTFSVTVSNVFNQWADIRGLRYEGVPLPLNGYATGASYAPYTGASAAEQFGLPYRTIYFNYELRG